MRFGHIRKSLIHYFCNIDESLSDFGSILTVFLLIMTSLLGMEKSCQAVGSLNVTLMQNMTSGSVFRQCKTDTNGPYSIIYMAIHSW